MSFSLEGKSVGNIKLTEDVLLHFPEAMLFHYIFNYNQIE